MTPPWEMVGAKDLLPPAWERAWGSLCRAAIALTSNGASWELSIGYWLARVPTHYGK